MLSHLTAPSSREKRRKRAILTELPISCHYTYNGPISISVAFFWFILREETFPCSSNPHSVLYPSQSCHDFSAISCLFKLLLSAIYNPSHLLKNSDNKSWQKIFMLLHCFQICPKTSYEGVYLHSISLHFHLPLAEYSNLCHSILSSTNS